MFFKMNKKMKNLKYLSFIGLMVFAVLFSCEPYEDTNPELGLVEPPAESEMDFSITPGDDAYRFNIEMTSPSLNGIYTVTFDLGNGSKINKKSGVAYYPLPDDYTITMTIKTNNGSSSISKTLTTSETDYSLFDNPMMIALSGGTDALEGKTWVLDSLSQGHLGVGPAGSEGLEWWSAAPLNKSGFEIYDDRLTFKMIGFEAIYENNGKSYVKDFRGDDPNYSNVVDPGDDLIVDYTPEPGSWMIEEADGKMYLVLSGPTPIYPMFDTGAQGGRYEIFALEENFMQLASLGGDGNAWAYRLIPEGYVPPQIELEATLTATGEVNTYNVALNVLNVPAGESINNVTIDFGDGTVHETQDFNEVVSNTYMRQGSYQVTVTANTSLGDIVKTFTAEVAANHPDYEPFLLDAMVTYNDFSEVSMAPLQIDLAGGGGYIEIVDNPDRTYPNKSAKVLNFVKENTEWANAYMQLPAGYRFDLRQRHTFKVMVYGSAGDNILLKLENTDRGGNAWQTGTYDLIYTIQQDNTWEIAEFDFSGVAAGWDWTGDIFTGDVTTDDNFNHDFYNVVRIMVNPGNADGTFQVYIDELAGPHVEGLKSATRN
jgi:hypothetical protein